MKNNATLPLLHFFTLSAVILVNILLQKYQIFTKFAATTEIA